TKKKGSVVVIGVVSLSLLIGLLVVTLGGRSDPGVPVAGESPTPTIALAPTVTPTRAPVATPAASTATPTRAPVATSTPTRTPVATPAPTATPTAAPTPTLVPTPTIPPGCQRLDEDRAVCDGRVVFLRTPTPAPSATPTATPVPVPPRPVTATCSPVEGRVVYYGRIYDAAKGPEDAPLRGSVVVYVATDQGVKVRDWSRVAQASASGLFCARLMPNEYYLVLVQAAGYHDTELLVRISADQKYYTDFALKRR
ncbi:MAG: hypothetical protein Q8P39_02320, partial [Candidatus Yanofskybacteria bacterium]|nr:hypothetical protein [Candidatus Yanofskybacteria bacterium]